MTMNETICERVIAALQSAGIPAFPEFPERLPPVPENRWFVTVSTEQAETGAAIPLPDGTAAVPVVIRLRVRTHSCTGDDLRRLSTQTAECLRAYMKQTGCDIRKASRGAVTYQKTIDRLQQEFLAEISGLMLPDEGDDNGNDS